MSRLSSCGTLAAGIPLLTENVGDMSAGMNIDALIAAAYPNYQLIMQNHFCHELHVNA